MSETSELSRQFWIPLVRAQSRVVHALMALTDPEGSLSSAINPGPERDELQRELDALVALYNQNGMKP